LAFDLAPSHLVLFRIRNPSTLRLLFRPQKALAASDQKIPRPLNI
jgi:hypothetical protein